MVDGEKANKTIEFQGDGQSLHRLGLDWNRGHYFCHCRIKRSIHLVGETLTWKKRSSLTAEELTKRYGSQIAVNSLNLSIYEGEVFGFLGPNGAGKTTSILMFLGLTEPTSGKVNVVGFDPTRDPFHVKEKVGYLPENVGFYDDMDARQNLRFIARLNRIPDKISKTRIDETLGLVGLLDEAKKKVGPLFERDEAAPGDCRGSDQGSQAHLSR